MAQALTPEEIRKATFHVTMRGYARDEVDEFLAALAKLVATLTERAETAYLNLGVRMGELLQEAKDAADELQSTSRAEA
ncbi:MAG: DivIVA domain-containing protein, partial [Actinomycetota bacterium]